MTIVIHKEVRPDGTYWGFALIEDGVLVYRQLPNWSTRREAKASAEFHLAQRTP